MILFFEIYVFLCDWLVLMEYLRENFIKDGSTLLRGKSEKIWRNISQSCSICRFLDFLQGYRKFFTSPFVYLKPFVDISRNFQPLQPLNFDTFQTNSFSWPMLSNFTQSKTKTKIHQVSSECQHGFLCLSFFKITRVIILELKIAHDNIIRLVTTNRSLNALWNVCFFQVTCDSRFDKRRMKKTEAIWNRKTNKTSKSFWL